MTFEEMYALACQRKKEMPEGKGKKQERNRAKGQREGPARHFFLPPGNFQKEYGGEHK